jgi:D-alanyl-D-alanine carboxypeptidase (penicillin-binding protein 5/6)
MRIIATVMGEESVTSRTSEVTALLDYGYANYKIDRLIDKTKVVDTIYLDKAKQKEVNIVTVDSVDKLNKKTSKLGNITYNLELNDIKIPTKSGDVVGKLEVLEDGKVVDKVDVTVSENIEKIDFLSLFSRYMSDILKGNISF